MGKKGRLERLCSWMKGGRDEMCGWKYIYRCSFYTYVRVCVCIALPSIV